MIAGFARQLEARKCFELGQVILSEGALKLCHYGMVHPFQFLARHSAGDFGSLKDQDIEANKQAIASGHDRVLSAYDIAGHKLLVITEADRSSTTMILSEEL